MMYLEWPGEALAHTAGSLRRDPTEFPCFLGPFLLLENDYTMCGVARLDPVHIVRVVRSLLTLALRANRGNRGRSRAQLACLV